MSSFACTRTEGERVALTGHKPGFYATRVHAAFSRGYDGATGALCGKGLYDPYPEARGAAAWDEVNCKACRKSIAKIEASK